MTANQLVDTAVQIKAVEIRGTILGLYERGLADEGYFESDYTAKMLEPDAPPAFEAAELERSIDAAWDWLQHWHFFQSDSWPASRVAVEGPETTRPGPPPASKYISTPPVPYRAPPKAGRNDPCPCGSGKKFKKCCGA